MAARRYEVYIENDTVSPEDNRLVLAQFPALRSQFDNEADRLHLSVKPKSLKLKLDVDLNCHSKSFSSRRAELLAEKSKPQLYPNRKVDKNVYTSTRNDVDDSQLFVCKIVGGKLVCRPISDVISFRSDLTHFDLKEEVDSREEIKPVSVKFAATDRQNLPAKPKDNALENDESLEEFRPFKIHHCESETSKLQREDLFGIGLSDVKIKLEPGLMEVDGQKPIATARELDIKPKIEDLDVQDIYSSHLLNRPGSPKKSSIINSRVKECLLKAKLVSFEETYQYLKDYRDFSAHRLDGSLIPINVKDIIDALNEYAVLVQGNWAVKSEILYGDSTIRDTTDVTGISINLFVAARDYLLWLFNQERFVSRPSFTEQVKIPDYDVLELFNQLATFDRESRSWELKLATDHRFLDKFPEIVQRQNTFWKVRKANKLSLFLKD